MYNRINMSQYSENRFQSTSIIFSVVSSVHCQQLHICVFSTDFVGKTAVKFFLFE